MSLEQKPSSRSAGTPSSRPQHAQAGEHSSSRAWKGKTWFFGIGINNYTYFSPLNNAVKDVKDIQQLLLKKYDLETQRAILLYDLEATREKIIGKLDELVTQIPEEDRLIIYYSGHGHLSPVNGYWIPVNAQKRKTAHYISNSTVRDYIKAIKARHTLLISDSCFSGSLFVRGTGRTDTAANDLEAIPSRWALCSGRHDEEVYDGEPGQNSPFAESILDTLRHNQHKTLNIAKLANRVVEQTRSNYQQLPEGAPLYGVGHKGGQFIFRLKLHEADDWIACQNTGTLAAYLGFVAKYPNGKHTAEAKQNITFLEEEEAWKTACQTNTLPAYYVYDRQYPQGRYTRQALTLIRELEEEKAWATAQQRNTFSSYRKYTLNYPEGKYRKEANAQMDSIAADQPETAKNKPETEQQAKVLPAEDQKVEPGPLKKYASRGLPVLLALLIIAWGISKWAGNRKQPTTTLLSKELLEKNIKQLGIGIADLNLKVVKDKVYITGKVRTEADKLKLITFLKRQKGVAGVEERLEVLMPADKEETRPTKDPPQNTNNRFGTVTAEGKTYKTIVLNGQTWLAENMNTKISGSSWCYNDSQRNCQIYGQLYTLEAAEKACKLLGAGWQLPTDNDWRKMARQLGGIYQDASDKGSAAYKNLSQNGKSGFNALLGGYRTPTDTYDLKGSSGRYWSSSPDSGSKYYSYYFNGSKRKLYRGSLHKSQGLSCRCVKRMF